jgi:hypothetical protein
MTQFEKLDLLLRECGGTIQTFQVLNNGISKSVFYAYVKERGLEQAVHLHFFLSSIPHSIDAVSEM